MRRVTMHDDHGEFARLVRRWQEPLRRLCSRLTGDRHRGEDLAQEAFARLFERRKDYQATGRFSTYLWRIALNLCRDEWRRKERRRVLHLEEEAGADGGVEETADAGPAPDALAAAREEGELVRQALLRLPDIYRTVLVLRHYEGLKLGQIAEVLEIPEGTVNSRMAEALSRLGRLLEPKLGAQPAPALGPNPVNKSNGVVVL